MDKLIREISPIRHNGRATIIGVDFDDTLCENKFPDIGDPYYKIICALINFRMNGGKLILWTCRNGEKLQEAVEWCKKFGLCFDAVNENTQEVKLKHPEFSCKICVDFFLDDRNL